MGDRRRCNWCGKSALAIGDEGARALGWLVGLTAMCPKCAGPEVCSLCGQQECPPRCAYAGKYEAGGIDDV